MKLSIPLVSILLLSFEQLCHAKSSPLQPRQGGHFGLVGRDLCLANQVFCDNGCLSSTSKCCGDGGGGCDISEDCIPSGCCAKGAICTDPEEPAAVASTIQALSAAGSTTASVVTSFSARDTVSSFAATSSASTPTSAPSSSHSVSASSVSASVSSVSSAAAAASASASASASKTGSAVSIDLPSRLMVTVAGLIIAGGVVYLV